MDILYTRTSTVEQNSERQSVNKDDYDLLIQDKCSGTIPFFEREGGKKIMNMLLKSNIESLTVHSIDRLGRDLLDILNTIEYFTKQKVNIFFKQQGLNTLDDEGIENPISKMMISILGVVAEMERKMIRERQLEGIAIAKAKGIYNGRLKGTKEDVFDFMSKPKNKKALDLVNKGYKNAEVAKIVGLHANTVTKIKKLKNHNDGNN